MKEKKIPFLKHSFLIMSLTSSVDKAARKVKKPKQKAIREKNGDEKELDEEEWDEVSGSSLP